MYVFVLVNVCFACKQCFKNKDRPGPKSRAKAINTSKLLLIGFGPEEPDSAVFWKPLDPLKFNNH